jgi:hypothetical protein
LIVLYDEDAARRVGSIDDVELVHVGRPLQLTFLPSRDGKPEKTASATMCDAEAIVLMRRIASSA